jgi:hypothetical protein
MRNEESGIRGEEVSMKMIQPSPCHPFFYYEIRVASDSEVNLERTTNPEVNSGRTTNNKQSRSEFGTNNAITG